jgi:biopolymer transport protein ExbD
MSFGGFGGGTNAPMSEINMVPLIDVMLVLLVIFIVTAPLLTHAVKIDLPKASSEVNPTQRENVQLAIAANGDVYWNGEPVERSALEPRFAEAARAPLPPELHVRADRQTEYGNVAQVMSMAARAGLTRIGFVTDPSIAQP